MAGDRAHRITVTELLRGSPIDWPSEESPKDFRDRHRDAIVYEDEDVLAVTQRDDDHGSEPGTWETRVTIVPKRHVVSLLDLDAADGPVALALLRGVQQVAYHLGLQHTGFEIRIDVLPPSQKRDLLAIKVRSGKHKSKPTDSAS